MRSERNCKLNEVQCNSDSWPVRKAWERSNPELSLGVLGRRAYFSTISLFVLIFVYKGHSLCEGAVVGCIALIFVKCFVDKHFLNRTDLCSSVNLCSLGNLHAFTISAAAFNCISHTCQL